MQRTANCSPVGSIGENAFALLVRVEAITAFGFVDGIDEFAVFREFGREMGGVWHRAGDAANLAPLDHDLVAPAATLSVPAFHRVAGVGECAQSF